MGAYPKSVMTKLGRVRKLGGGDVPTMKMAVAASQTIKQGDLLIPNSSTKLLEQAVTNADLTTDGYGFTADVVGRVFVAMQDYTSDGSATVDEKMVVAELTSEVQVLLCIGNFPTTAGAMGTAAAESAPLKQDTIYGVGRYRTIGATYFYGMDTAAPSTPTAGLKLYEFSPEKGIDETYPFAWFAKAPAQGV